MAKASYPRTVKRGQLAGLTFLSEEEYQAAVKAGGLQAEGGPVTVKKSAKPKPTFSKDMVGALVKMIEGLTQFIPSFRGAPFTEQETRWLVNDWYDFGRSNLWFRGAIETLFGLTSDGKLVATHIAVFGGRLCTHEIAVDGRVEVVKGLVPEAFDPQVRMIASLAYMGRLAMEGEDAAAIGLETRPASSPDRQNGVGEDHDVEAALSVAGPYDPASS